MEENTIKNVVDFKYNDFEIGDEIEFGKWNDYHGNKPAIWTVLKKIDFSNLSDDDNKWLEYNFSKPEEVKKAYDGKAIIVKIYGWTRVYFSCEYVKDESLDRGYYLNFHYTNEWFDKEEFPIVLNETENDLLIVKNFISYDADCNWSPKKIKNSDYLGKDLLLKEYYDSSKLLYDVGEGEDSDLFDNWGIDFDEDLDKINDIYDYREGDFNFKTNSIMYSRRKVDGDLIEEYTAFNEHYYPDIILDMVEECKENDCDIQDILCAKEDFNIIKLLIIKVKD